MRITLDVFTDPVIVSGATVHSQQDPGLKDRRVGGLERRVEAQRWIEAEQWQGTGLGPSWYLVEVGAPV